MWLSSWSVAQSKTDIYPNKAYGIHIGLMALRNGDRNPPIVPNTIPSDVACDRIGVGNNSAAHKYTTK